MLDIAVVGAGWYGCHIAATLAALGLNVTVYEREPEIFASASGNNQFRLHMGFHYPRSHKTRMQTRDGYARFLERYPALSHAFDLNIYAVPTSSSSIDFPTYKLIMSAAGIEFREGGAADLKKWEYAHIDGLMFCDERVIRTTRARQYFLRRLGKALQLESPVEAVTQTVHGVQVNGRKFDFMIDTTWGHLSRPAIPCYWEPTVLFYYSGAPNEPALTLVDGPLPSLYPTESEGLYTLSSVPTTPVGQFASAAEAIIARDSVNTADLKQKREAMEAQISRYLPSFTDRFRFEGVQLSIKTKPVGASDDRSCSVGQYGRCFSVMSGKIDTIFFAAQAVIAKLEAFVDSAELDLRAQF